MLSFVKLCEDHGKTYHWTSGQKPHLAQNGKKMDGNTPNYVPFVVPGLSRNSSTAPIPTSSTSSSQDSVFDASRYNENPVLERNGSMSEELRGNPVHRPTENENTNKKKGREEVESDLLHDLPYWLQEFREKLVDESSPLEPWRNPAPKDQDTSSSSHELPMESRAKVDPGSGKHSIYSFRTKITRASCRRRADTVVPRAENVSDLITADHKVLNEGRASRHNRRYAVVVQDLAKQWIQSYSCKTKTSQETEKNLTKVPGADEETKLHLH